MDDALLVRGIETVGDLPRDRENLRQRRARVRISGDLLSKCQPFHELHDQGRRAPGFFEAVYLRDVWMIQRREDSRLPLEACEALAIAGEPAAAP